MSKVGTSVPTRRLETIQLLRGLAAMLVVFHHISHDNHLYFDYELWGTIFSLGWSGVDFFFVLSGFIITYIHYRDIGKKEKAELYFKKRIIRIYPPYWVFTTISLVFFLVFKSEPIYREALYIVKSYLLVPQSMAPILSVGWSLSYEMYFYLLFGIFILTSLRVSLIVLFFQLALIVVFEILSLSPQTFEVFSVGSNYILEFIFGVIVAYLVLHDRASVIYPYRLHLLLLGFLLFSLACYLSFNFSFFGRYAIQTRFTFGIASSLIILGATQIQVLWKSKLYELGLMVGDASYTLYLFHPLVVALAFKGMAGPLKKLGDPVIYQAFSLGVFMLCVISAIFFYRKVESRMTHYLTKRFIRITSSRYRQKLA